ncbi:hypothetical protein SAMN02799630_03715 [Paenibacillus sp. UNCCL117]|uniref:hypothetical protein n=1 Tax=unclassified Paenibacillus TaxID=185978 RepID=UPI0008869286|nr:MULTISPECIES: hypothetical protein [unclassified Paenibacillus]SDD50047.1 hypothetical protein SAMN04488602_10982 [Paenibacillus sp. cl123]SFW49805.1 hypothetical protein SAMN02799630_03715 [Paenibacillus sp. UNCCL117]
MKNFLSLLVILSLFLIAMGCQSSKVENKAASTTPATAQNDADVKESGQKINVDKGLVDVEVTLPASFFNGQDIDKAIEKAKSDGVKEAKKNADGSVTYVISKAKHTEMMKTLEDSMLEAVDNLKNDKNFKSIKNVNVDKKYAEFTVTVDKNVFEKSFDAIGLLGIGISSMYYQIFEGSASDQVKATIKLKDEATGTTFKTIVYPDDMNKQ